MFPRRFIGVVSLFLALLLNPPAHAADDTPADLVLIQQGTLPIILTVPHGGRKPIPGVEERNIKGKSGSSRAATPTPTYWDRASPSKSRSLRARSPTW